jgi:hypothetical protein
MLKEVPQIFFFLSSWGHGEDCLYQELKKKKVLKTAVLTTYYEVKIKAALFQMQKMKLACWVCLFFCRVSSKYLPFWKCNPR